MKEGKGQKEGFQKDVFMSGSEEDDYNDDLSNNNKTNSTYMVCLPKYYKLLECIKENELNLLSWGQGIDITMLLSLNKVVC